MSDTIDMDRLNEHDRMVAAETINLVYEDLSKWDDALRVNQTRAEDACHFKQAERLQDARSHYQRRHRPHPHPTGQPHRSSQRP